MRECACSSSLPLSVTLTFQPINKCNLKESHASLCNKAGDDGDDDDDQEQGLAFAP